jgi:hypothetical protein
MSNLQGKVGELRMIVEVTRAATGLKETHELIGFLDEEQAKEFIAAQQSGAQQQPVQE